LGDVVGGWLSLAVDGPFSAPAVLRYLYFGEACCLTTQ